MRNLYVVLIASNYNTGKIIRFFTRGKYNHVGLSIDESLSSVYSFSRGNLYEPFIGGFQNESMKRYLYNNPKTPLKIIKMEVSNDVYNRALQKIQDFEKYKDETSYQLFDVVVYPFKYHIPLEKCHTCISFVLDLLEYGKFESINQFEKNNADKVFFEGYMDEYDLEYRNEDNYFCRNNSIVRRSLLCNATLLMRLMRLGKKKILSLK